jgi:hypothetical protein
MKNKLEKLNQKEEAINTELHRYKNLEKNFDDIFKKEVNEYNISEDSLIE